MKKSHQIFYSIMCVFVFLFLITSISCLFQGNSKDGLVMLGCTLLFITSTISLYSWDLADIKIERLSNELNELEHDNENLRIWKTAYRSKVIELNNELMVEKSKNNQPNWCHPIEEKKK